MLFFSSKDGSVKKSPYYIVHNANDVMNKFPRLKINQTDFRQ